jgi:hypothetical protein
LSWIDRLGLSDALFRQLNELYSSDGANNRNRAMHAALFETHSRKMETLFGGSAPNNPYSPTNLLQSFLKDLEDLDAEASSAGVNGSDLAWANDLWLTADDIEFANTIPCDLLDEQNGEAWRARFKSFIDKSLPCFATPSKVALMGWLDRFKQHNSLTTFMVWGMLFEALYRLTAHVIGFKVIQRQRKGPNERMFQYRMLDSRENGLSSPEIVGCLIENLDPADREKATRTIDLAVKVRNALAHGATVSYNDDGHLAAGHFVIKATQILMQVTEEHMTREAAYYRSLNRPRSRPAHPDEDWDYAEVEIHRLLGYR